MNHGPVIVLIPAFNESRTLAAVVQAVRDQDPGREIVVIDDGSRDDTAEVARGGGALVIRHPFNLGYGAALQTGYKYALHRGASILVQMDADGQHHPSDIEALTAPIENDECDLVIGSRFLQATSYEMGVSRSVGRFVLLRIARLCGLRITDPTSGFQALNRSVLELFARDFFPSDYPDVDVLLIAKQCGVRIAERPVEMSPSPRESTMHGGLASFYYAYKMLVSILTSLKKPSPES